MVRYVYFKSTRIYLKVLLPKSLLRMPPARPLSAALPPPAGRLPLRRSQNIHFLNRAFALICGTYATR